MPSQPIPRRQSTQLCACGCGQFTLLAPKTVARQGAVRGQPLRYIHGHQTRGRHISTYTGVHRTAAGYVMRRAPEHPHANGNGWVCDHRLVVERELGRYLLPEEEVHHRNGIKDDNRPANLEVLSRSEHRRLHSLRQDYLQGRWSMEHERCIACERTDRPHAGFGRCRTCYQRYRMASRSDRRPV